MGLVQTSVSICAVFVALELRFFVFFAPEGL